MRQPFGHGELPDSALNPKETETSCTYSGIDEIHGQMFPKNKRQSQPKHEGAMMSLVLAEKMSNCGHSGHFREKLTTEAQRTQRKNKQFS
jgi:hypothetical protein